jgi:hypothetical protein
MAIYTLRYTLDAIAYALSLWGYAQATAAKTQQAVSAAKARGFSAPEQWSLLRRPIDSGEPLTLLDPPVSGADAAPGYAVITAICDNPLCDCTVIWFDIAAIYINQGSTGHA